MNHIQELLHQQKDTLVFLILDPEDDFEGDVEQIPEEVCVTVRFCGSHWDAPAQNQKLAEFLTEHKLQITGFSKKITMIDYGITSDTEQFYNYTLFDRRGFYFVLYLRFYRYLSIFSFITHWPFLVDPTLSIIPSF